MVEDCERAISLARERVSSQSWAERAEAVLLLIESGVGAVRSGLEELW